jgi:chemosensory pili system protein ChpA (sensor histidine kinase/response regulator)
MGDRHDYVALEWVKGEIAETLKQARQSLEAFVENPQDLTRMRFCLTYLHQVQGTLQMVEFYGAALLAEEMEHLAQALLESRVSNQTEALEVLMQAILQLPVYLDRTQSARRDLPMVVLPLLNDLRACRGEKFLSETSLFLPDLANQLPALSHESLAQLRTAELPVLLRKLRQMLQMALVGVIRSQDLATNLGYMARVFARLETLCKEAPLGPLWQMASAIVEGLANGSVINGTSVRTLLRQVDKELKRLVEQGADGINQAAPDDLAKNLLFYIAKAATQSPRIRALKERYRLDDALPDTDVVDQERARLAGPDRDAMRSVVAALCEELVRVKDSLDLFVRSDREQIAELETLMAPLKQIADTLAVLGFGQPRKVIVDQIDVVHDLAIGRCAPSDAVLMDVAGALLYVEATLAGMVGPADDGRHESSHLPTTDVAQIHQLVIKEARTGLEQAKDAIIEFISSQWDHVHLARVPELLTQVRGGLAMIPLTRAADLLRACNSYIQEQLLVRKAVPNWQDLDTLADAITSVEYYLERLSEDHAAQGDLILDVAEESLEALGYPLKEKPSILDWPAERFAPAPLDDPLHDIEVLADEPATELTADEPVLSELMGDSEEPDAAKLRFEMLPELITPASADTVLLEEAVFLPDLAAEPSIETLGFSLDDVSPEPADIPSESAESYDLDEVVEITELPVPTILEEAFDLEELSLDDSPAHWNADELAELDLPEVDLPYTPLTVDVPSAVETQGLSMADVMAAPVQETNPPATDVPPSLLPPPADEEPVDDELLEVFVEEAGEVLQTIAEYLPIWRADTRNKHDLSEVRRAFHTLKGSGRMVRALVIGELAWSIENLLNRVLERSIEPGEEVQHVIADVVELMPTLVDEYAGKCQRQRDDVDLLAATAHALAKGQLPVRASVSDEADADIAGSADTLEAAALEPADEALDEQLLEIFRNEAETHLETIVAFLADCAQELPQPVTDDLQRALHTLKGSAYMAGILPVAEIAAPLEKLVKEYKSHLIAMDMAEAELLNSAEQMFRAGLEQLEQQPLAPIAGAPEFIARVHALHQERLAVAEQSRQGESGETRDPQLINIFLAEGMDILLDAEDLLRSWREHPAEQQELSALLDELNTLERGAQMAELPQIEQICQALVQVYAAVQEGRLAVSEAFFNGAENAHEALVHMMDQVAAGLQVGVQSEPLAALQHLLTQILEPETLALLEPDQVAGFEFTELDNQPENIHLSALPSTLETEELAFEPELLGKPELEPGDSLAAAQATEPLVEHIDFESPFAEDAAPIDAVEPFLDEEMVEIFLEEAVDLLESTSASLERWLEEPENQRALASLLRDLHTLKGGARMAEIGPIGDLAHELESIYEGLVDRRYSFSADLTGLLQQSHDRLAVLLEDLQAKRPMDEPLELIEAIRHFRQTGTTRSELDLAAAQQPDAEIAPLLSVADEPAILESEEFVAQSGEESSADSEFDDTDTDLLLEAPLFDADADADADAESLDAVSEPTFDADALEAEAEEPAQEIDLESLIDIELSDVELDAAFNAIAVDEPLAVQEAILPGVNEVVDNTADAEENILLDSLEDAEDVAQSPALVPAAVVDERDQELVEIFLEEGFDIIESASASLQNWMSDVNNSLELEALQRDLHTLKGGARMAEIAGIGDLAHELEFLYEGLSNGRLRASPELFNLLQNCHDCLAQMLEAERDRTAPPSGNSLIADIKKFLANPQQQLSMPVSVHLSAVAEVQSDAPEDDILDIFLEEADELLEGLETAVGRLESSDNDAAAIDDMLRILHTLKGGARLAGQKSLGDVSHDLEQLLSDAQQQGAPWPESLFVDVQSAFEGLQSEVEQLRQHLYSSNSAPAVPPVQSIENDQELAPSASPVARVALSLPIIAASALPAKLEVAKVLPFVKRAQEAALEAASRRAPQELVKVPADLLEGLVNLAGETSIFRGRVEQQVSDVSFTLGEMEATIDRVRDQLRRLDTETQAQILSRYQEEAERVGYEDFDPLEMDRHSQLQQLSRALFESASDLLDLKETLAARNRDAETLLLQQARVNTELQEGLMRTRMVPFDRLVPRLRRIVRQVAGELNKQVDFVVGNADGEMDRAVLERIVAPLEHMLRNAVDHGIEPADVRRAAGKPEVGNIRLTLGREGGDILLTLADDGGGIRLEAVRHKAIERGMLDADADLSDHEILQFILEAGFTTAEKVTQISGRGVGMDVVHSEVKQLGGSMSIESTPGEGTRFLIRLPFTVSVNRALMVLSGEDLYAIPLNTIEGIVRVSPYELEAYYGPDAPRFEYAGQVYELKYLGDLLNNGQQPKLTGQSLPLPVILVRSNEHAVAVQVDSLAGSREIVVKSLGPQFASVHGVSGATILGDGRVVIILDLLATIRVLHAHLLSQLQPRLAGASTVNPEVELDRPVLVMVVDDSVTVRKVTSRLLERNGMNVMTAKDGVDAIAQLHERKPDIMLLDIEMPRMDGFEVATLVRHDERLKDLPIIMITSRTGSKHRDRAMTIGVNEYLGKPYQESLLLETIQQLVNKHD